MHEIIEIQFGNKIPTKLFKFRCELVDYENECEKEYIAELIATLKEGMVVYDIGAENGELSVLAGNIVGGENVHIFEPNKDYFPNIKAIWEANNLNPPFNCFNGYVGEKTSDWINFIELNEVEGEIFTGCLHPNNIDTPMETLSLDDYSAAFMPPDVIMMDIEGAELSVMKGAKELLQNYSVIFFISIHKPEFIKHRSNGTKEDLLKIFSDNGYQAIHLATDHEEHWKFVKKN